MSAEVSELKFHDIPYTTKEIFKVAKPTAKGLMVHSLSALGSYLTDNVAAETKAPIVHIIDQETVNVISMLEDNYRIRETYLQSTLINTPFCFGAFHPAENFIISLQAQFVQDETTAQIMKVVGNITEEAEHKIMDDGVTQTVTAKAGIAKIENVSVPNPVELRPYRTFQEIEQPASKFVFRMKKSRDGDGPTCALFEADGGAWKNEAISNIKDYLVANLPVGTVVIA